MLSTAFSVSTSALTDILTDGLVYSRHSDLVRQSELSLSLKETDQTVLNKMLTARENDIIVMTPHMVGPLHTTTVFHQPAEACNEKQIHNLADHRHCHQQPSINWRGSFPLVQSWNYYETIFLTHWQSPPTVPLRTSAANLHSTRWAGSGRECRGCWCYLSVGGGYARLAAWSNYRRQRTFGGLAAYVASAKMKR
jgi:hypothetical protein